MLEVKDNDALQELAKLSLHFGINELLIQMEEIRGFEMEHFLAKSADQFVESLTREVGKQVAWVLQKLNLKEIDMEEPICDRWVAMCKCLIAEPDQTGCLQQPINFLLAKYTGVLDMETEFP